MRRYIQLGNIVMEKTFGNYILNLGMYYNEKMFGIGRLALVNNSL